MLKARALNRYKGAKFAYFVCKKCFVWTAFTESLSSLVESTPLCGNLHRAVNLALSEAFQRVIVEHFDCLFVLIPSKQTKHGSQILWFSAVIFIYVSFD